MEFEESNQEQQVINNLHNNPDIKTYYDVELQKSFVWVDGRWTVMS